MNMRGPKLVIILVILTMAATIGYVIHTSKQAAQAGPPEDTRSLRTRQLDKAMDDLEAALGGKRVDSSRNQ